MIPEKDLITWTVVIAGYGMHGFGNEEIATFQMMRIAGINPDAITFPSIFMLAVILDYSIRGGNFLIP